MAVKNVVTLGFLGTGTSFVVTLGFSLETIYGPVITDVLECQTITDTIEAEVHTDVMECQTVTDVVEG